MFQLTRSVAVRPSSSREHISCPLDMCLEPVTTKQRLAERIDCSRLPRGRYHLHALRDNSDDHWQRSRQQLQLPAAPRVDGNIKNFNFSGPLVISYERHEENSQSSSSVTSAANIVAELQMYFPAITEDVVEEIPKLYPASHYANAGYRLSDIRQGFDMTGKNLALLRRCIMRRGMLLSILGKLHMERTLPRH
ncbi:hypothetical protein ASPFODRAFT_223016 [Aspergillus luchuensis CBS 106.47]|uniref:Uncharacterized protein n=1 Tax=Aspergillus luchuensis (strain CBS 106.47) TaxID=1137211 RepID=A0A1M3T3M3_ASPLC|nr:hypothetical protein ASPFODRAFT_223016 [Aspergillus luchuensis CBS 106.47]